MMFGITKCQRGTTSINRDNIKSKAESKTKPYHIHFDQLRSVVFLQRIVNAKPFSTKSLGVILHSTTHSAPPPLLDMLLV